ncbi:MAG: hypothetical protein JO360_12005 [Acidobacteria bacterium]|nr:hypothetical protein [Acidobacteriota bacterium]
MKATKHFKLCCALCLSLICFYSFAVGRTRAGKRNPRLIVSFYSICCGIDLPAKEKLDGFISQYEKRNRKRIAKSTVHWGKEGEVDYCLPLSNLSGKEQRRFISQVRSLLRGSKQVNIKENEACQSEQPATR